MYSNTQELSCRFGIAEEQILRAMVGEMGYILQHRSGNGSTLSYCHHVGNVVPLTEMGVSSIWYFSAYVFSLFSICSKLCNLE